MERSGSVAHVMYALGTDDPCSKYMEVQCIEKKSDS